jgi:radical SAM superfamily enzyme YgiQ (UPF0313 family)
MNYEGRIIRPPNEADSLILQIAVGCSHNRCTFCPAFKEKKFRIKPIDDIRHEIRQAVSIYGAASVHRVFLCDGDPLIIPQDTLIDILDELNAAFPRLQRIGIYGNANSVLKKSGDDLAGLKKRKLSIVYLGLESGDSVTLKRINKGSTADQMIDAALKVRQAGIKLNVTVLLGIGGTERSSVHAVATMRVLNRMKPNHIGALTLMVVPGTPLYDEMKKGDFVLPDKFELVSELREMVAESELENCLFFSNHASNYFPVQARLPRDKETILQQLDFVLSSRSDKHLRKEFMRAL